MKRFLLTGFILFIIIFFSISNNVESEEPKYVYSIGKVVGIKAETEGVLVIGYENDDSEYIGGIKIGDTILEIDNKKIENVNQIPEILKNIDNSKVEVLIKRDDEYKKELVKIDKKNSRLGLWVRDKVSGIGTLTFYDVENEKFKGIGHPITDSDTNELLDIKIGNIYYPQNISIKKPNGNVGYIKGEFDFKNPIGNFKNNYNYGISADINLKTDDYQMIELGNKYDIKTGKAYILFENKDRKVESYEIKIDEIYLENKDSKQILLEIVDKSLLDYTGGIVQGMSGAPIIQDNKIIGAITHVFKDDAKKGYGIFIDEMIELDENNKN